MNWKLWRKTAEKTLQALNETAENMVDPETRAEVSIEFIEEKYDNFNKQFKLAENKWKSKQADVVRIKALREQRLAAAEHLGKQLENDPNNSALESALTELLDTLEEMEDDIQQEIQKEEDAAQVMNDIKEMVNMYGVKLKQSRKNTDKVITNIKRQMMRKEANDEKARLAAEKAGITTKTNSLDKALDSLQRQAAELEAEADAAARKAKLLNPTPVEENDLVAAAMRATSGEAPKSTSVKDRLAALRK